MRSHEDLHVVTFEIIQRIGPPAIPLLVDLLRHEWDSIRRNASPAVNAATLTTLGCDLPQRHKKPASNRTHVLKCTLAPRIQRSSRARRAVGALT
jgi:hypothetical protein